MSAYSRIAYVVSHILRAVSLFGAQAIAIRLLGIEDFGSVTFYLALPLFASVYAGMVSAEKITKVWGVTSQEQQNISTGMYRVVLKYELVMLLVSLPLVILLTSGMMSFRTPGEISVLLITLPALLGIGYQTNSHILLFEKQYKPLVIILITESILNIILVFLAIPLGMNGYMLAVGLRLLTVGCMCFYFVRRVVNFDNLNASNGEANAIHLRHQHKTLLLKSGWGNLDSLVVGLVSSSAIVGEYRLIKSLANILPTLFLPIWNTYKADMIVYAKKSDWTSVKALIFKVASISSVIALITLVAMNPFYNRLFIYIYQVEPSRTFFIVFWSVILSSLVSNVTTGWSRFLAVLRNQLSISLYGNIFLTIALLIAPLIQLSTGISVPIVISIALASVALFWWVWLVIYV